MQLDAQLTLIAAEAPKAPAIGGGATAPNTKPRKPRRDLLATLLGLSNTERELLALCCAAETGTVGLNPFACFNRPSYQVQALVAGLQLPNDHEAHDFLTSQSQLRRSGLLSRGRGYHPAHGYQAHSPLRGVGLGLQGGQAGPGASGPGHACQQPAGAGIGHPVSSPGGAYRRMALPVLYGRQAARGADSGRPKALARSARGRAGGWVQGAALMRAATDPWAGNLMHRACVGPGARAAQSQHRPQGAKIDSDVPAPLVGARIGANKAATLRQSPP